MFGSNFPNFALLIFLSPVLLGSAATSAFLPLGVEIRFWSRTLCSHHFVLCNSVSADRSGMPASRFQTAAAASMVLNIASCSMEKMLRPRSAQACLNVGPTSNSPSLLRLEFDGASHGTENTVEC